MGVSNNTRSVPQHTQYLFILSRHEGTQEVLTFECTAVSSGSYM